MRLIIAAKPELAKAIVEGPGGGARESSYCDCGGDRVTYCIGHMLELTEPEDSRVKQTYPDLKGKPDYPRHKE